jgi:hypothetical protein
MSKNPRPLPAGGFCFHRRKGSPEGLPLDDYMNDGISGASIWTT